MWPRKMSLAYDRIRGGDVDSEAQPFTDGEAEKQQGMMKSSSIQMSRLQQLWEIVRAIISLLCLWIVVVATWRTTLHPVPRAVKYEKQTLHCGNTTAEAESRGCAFDLLSHNWVAPPCLDPLTDSEYREYISSPERHFGPYPYYLDEEGTKRVPDERAFALLANGPTLADQHVFTTREEHLAHCRFILRRTHRAAQGKVLLNDENNQLWHADHCLGELANSDKKPLDALNEGFYIGFAPCTIEVPL